MSRADKKRKVAPYLPFETIRVVSKLRIYRGDNGIGDAGRAIVLASLHDAETVSALAPYFARDYAIGGTAWHGHRKHKPIESFIMQYGQGTERLYMRFTKSEESELDDFKVALGAKYLSDTVAALILISGARVFERIAPGFLNTASLGGV